MSCPNCCFFLQEQGILYKQYILVGVIEEHFLLNELFWLCLFLSKFKKIKFVTYIYIVKCYLKCYIFQWATAEILSGESLVMGHCIVSEHRIVYHVYRSETIIIIILVFLTLWKSNVDICLLLCLKFVAIDIVNFKFELFGHICTRCTILYLI